MRSALKEDLNAHMGAVQEDLSKLKPLQRMANAVEREFGKDYTNDAPHTNPTSMSTQVPASFVAATTTPSPMPTATDVRSLIER